MTDTIPPPVALEAPERAPLARWARSRLEADLAALEANRPPWWRPGRRARWSQLVEVGRRLSAGAPPEVVAAPPSALRWFAVETATAAGAVLVAVAVAVLVWPDRAPAPAAPASTTLAPVSVACVPPPAGPDGDRFDADRCEASQ